MKKGLDLEVNGKLDWLLARNLEEYSEIWCRYRPNLFKHPVKIRTERFTTHATSKPHAFACAFSGGVDSSYALATTARLNNAHTPPSKLAVIVDGFGFNLEDPGPFQAVYKQGSYFAALLGDIKIKRVRTNWSRVLGWYQIFHTIGLAAVMSSFSSMVDGAYIALDFSYEEEFELGPWGNLSLVDRLYSSSKFQILPAGGNVRRVDKVKYLADREYDHHLSVCNSPERSALNCGKCEKCIRTMLFYEANEAAPKSGVFPTSLSQNAVEKVKITKKTQKIFYSQILEALQKNGSSYSEPVREVLSRSTV